MKKVINLKTVVPINEIEKDCYSSFSRANFNVNPNKEQINGSKHNKNTIGI